LLAQRLGPQCKKEAGLLPFSSWSGLLVSLFLDYPWDYLLSSAQPPYTIKLKNPFKDVKFTLKSQDAPLGRAGMNGQKGLFL